MATTNLPPSTGERTERPPFDKRLSSRIDSLVIRLDAPQPAMRRWWLRTQKRYWERKIPNVLSAIDLCANCQQELAFPDIDSFALCEDCRDRGVR